MVLRSKVAISWHTDEAGHRASHSREFGSGRFVARMSLWLPLLTRDRFGPAHLSLVNK